MSRFFVGQRVRLARPKLPENAGAEGRIARIGKWGFLDPLPGGRIAACEFDCIVSWDRSLIDAGTAHVFTTGPAGFWQLEPILDDRQSCEEQFKRDLDRLLERDGVSA